MNKFLSSLIVIGLLTSPVIHATGNYAGIAYGQVESEDLETGNLGFIIGRSSEKGLGFEFFYMTTVSEDSISSGPFSADVSIDTYGIFGVYRSAIDVYSTYFKARAGLAIVDLEFDFGDLGSIDDDTSGFAFGIAIGHRIGNGGLEFAYTVLPEFDDFDGIEVDAEVDMLSLSYYWDF
jgi:hypothetical protein